MGARIGLDLGTTFCVVTIPETRTGQGFFSIPQCPGVTVLQDSQGRATIPSVVAYDESGPSVVGYAAKNRVGTRPEPVMFAKRYMGTWQQFDVGPAGPVGPREVTTEIIKHVKRMAEERLGEPVEEVVVTVPAYFDWRAKQWTAQAAEAAGLRVAQVAMEPVAAAMMYCHNDPRRDLRILTFDLGGGTCDVAVIDKRDAVISTASLKAFGGDRFLGGYNFDLKLAHWLAGQLTSLGYEVTASPPTDESRALFAQLVVWAERAKIRLSGEERHRLEESSLNIRDLAGREVKAGDLVITRADFEEMIAEEIGYTIKLCRETLETGGKEPVDKASIEEVICVGGSTRIPLVQRRLEEEFGLRPRIVEPDLCVALGAGLIASTLGTIHGCLRLEAVPQETDLESLDVAGRVTPTEALPQVEGCRVRLAATDGSCDRSVPVEAEGGFAFLGVRLTPEATTTFDLTVLAPDGVEAERHSFSVHQTSRPRGGLLEPVTNVLARPIYIEFANELYEVAPKGTVLPYPARIPAKTTDTSGQIRVPFRCGNTPLGALLMPEVPESLHVGSDVNITVELGADFSLTAEVYVPSIPLRDRATLVIPQPEPKTREELRAWFDDLQKRAEQALASAGRGALIRDGRGLRIQEGLERCGELVQDPNSDLHMIENALDDVELNLALVGRGWQPQPSLLEFRAACMRARHILDVVLARAPEVKDDGYAERLDALREQAEQAYADEDSGRWRDCCRQATQIGEELERLLPPTPAPDPEVLKQMRRNKQSKLNDKLMLLETRIKSDEAYGEFSDDLNRLREDLLKINPEDDNAGAQLHTWELVHYENLRRRMERFEPGAEPGKLERDPGRKD